MLFVNSCGPITWSMLWIWVSIVPAQAEVGRYSRASLDKILVMEHGVCKSCWLLACLLECKPFSRDRVGQNLSQSSDTQGWKFLRPRRTGLYDFEVTRFR